MNDCALEVFADREQASAAAAERIAEALRSRLEGDARATFVASGGSTPVVCLNRLSDAALPWSRVDVTLTDERCVPVDHEDSNARMLAAELLRGPAAAASYYAPDAQEITGRHFAAVLLGMGADGHFASLFPDASSLTAGLDLDSEAETLVVDTQASPHRRLSMTLARLVTTDLLLLLVFGEDKRRVIENPAGLPIEALLQQSRQRPRILWAP